MILAIHSDASDCNRPKTRSRAGGHFFTSNNGTIHNTTQIIKQVMSSAMEAELGALYINSKFDTQIKHTAEMGHLR